MLLSHFYLVFALRVLLVHSQFFLDLVGLKIFMVWRAGDVFYTRKSLSAYEVAS